MICTRKAKFCNTLNNICTPLCTTHSKQIYKAHIKNITLKPFKIKNSNTLNFDDVKMKLIMEFEKMPNLLKADAVVIENQPSFKNPRMKSIASTIYDYYLIRGIIDRNITESNILQVKFMAPSNKLKLANVNDTKELIKVKTIGESKSYKLTKSLGIKYCLELISHMPEWVNHFNEHKKKDDLADAFLQGVYFMNNNTSNVVLSFDVGVVHMAYCLMKKDYFIINGTPTLTWSIIEWNNIDLTDRNEQKCACGKKATSTNCINDIQYFYCKVHAKKVNINKEPFENCFTNLLDDNKCDFYYVH